MSAERRRAVRYRTENPAIFCWEGPEDRHFQGKGIARDMSLQGAYILTGTCPPLNAVIQMRVFVPGLSGASRLRMKAEMTVLRVEPNITGSGQCGFAVVGNGFSLHTVSKRAPRPAAGPIEDSEEPVDE